MSFHNPWSFLLLVIPFAYLFYFLLYQRNKRASLQYSSLKGFKNLPLGLRGYFINLPTYLKILAMITMVVALARPQMADTKVKRNVEGIDIMLVLDISDSMLIEDMQPVNRLESAKKVVTNFINKRTSDRIGLAIFSGDTYTRVPLTLDYPILLESVKQLEISRAMKMGTAIGMGLANGVARLKDSTAKSRVIVLMTDGENNSGTIDPDTALEMAKGYGIRVYTIGVGQDGDAQLPVYTEDAFGRRVKTYQPISSKVNDELLGKIASVTGGKYYRATSTNALSNVFADIDKLEKTKIETNQFTRYTELFQKYLIWGFYLFLLAIILKYVFFRKGP